MSLFSSCCDAFIIFNDLTAMCSLCDKIVYTVSKNTVTSMIYYNTYLKNISAESVNKFNLIAPRFATDITCEKCTVLCNKCKSQTRYLKNPLGKIIFVCSNGDCREIVKYEN
jgi:hypothetical protein